MILMFIRNVLEWFQDTLTCTFSKLKYTITRLALIITVFVILLWFSAFLYGSFYFAYMPPVSFSTRVNLKFKICEDGIGMCSYPTDNISLIKDGQNEVFVKGEAYSIVMDIELPESPVNKELGMFMVKLSLYGRKGETVASSSRSVMLHYRSELLRILDTFVFSPLFLSGFAEQKQSLTVEFYNSYLDDAYNPAVGAVIEVQSKKIQIYSSLLRIHAHFSGLRYILYYWPLLSAVVGTSLNMSLVSFIALVSWYQIYYNQSGESTQQTSRRSANKSLEERRKNVRKMLEQEREAQKEDFIPSYEGEEYSRLENIGGRDPPDETEDCLLQEKSPLEQDSDSTVRKRHSIIVSS